VTISARDHLRVRELVADTNDMARISSATRECGSCRLCCKLLNVEQKGTLPGYEDEPPIRKPGWVWCREACDKGCRIYDARPKACREYSCLWLEGFWPDDFSPAEIGLVIHHENVDALGGATWHVYEKRPGQARATRRGRLLLAALVSDKRWPVAVLHGPEPGRPELTRVTIYANGGITHGHFTEGAERPEQEDWSK